MSYVSSFAADSAKLEELQRQLKEQSAKVDGRRRQGGG